MVWEKREKEARGRVEWEKGKGEEGWEEVGSGRNGKEKGVESKKRGVAVHLGLDTIPRSASAALCDCVFFRAIG